MANLMSVQTVKAYHTVHIVHNIVYRTAPDHSDFIFHTLFFLLCSSTERVKIYFPKVSTVTLFGVIKMLSKY